MPKKSAKEAIELSLALQLPFSLIFGEEETDEQKQVANQNVSEQKVYCEYSDRQ